MNSNLAALLSLAVVFSGSFALSTQSVEAKTSRNSTRRDRNYLVPPPPPYTPSMVSWTLAMMNAQALSANADKAIAEKQVNPYSNMQKVVQPNPYLSFNPAVEQKILKHIDSFDSEISSQEKEIGKLLNL